MGDILTVYKIFPEDIDEVNTIVEHLKTNTPKNFKLNSTELEPIAFGLKVVKASFIFPDKIDGLLDELENFLKSTPNVQQIESIATTLI